MAHPPARGHVLCGTRPLVHVGFMRSWLAGGFNEKVIKHIMQLVNRPRLVAGRLKIYVTGLLQFTVSDCVVGTLWFFSANATFPCAGQLAAI